MVQVKESQLSSINFFQKSNEVLLSCVDNNLKISTRNSEQNIDI